MNPLEKYFRSIEFYQMLPSGDSYYPIEVLEYTEGGEVGIRPMTSNDELLFKNPDAMLNGEAMKQTLLSCVVGLKDPLKLLSVDADALLLLIRHATYGDANEITAVCPKCSTSSTYGVNLSEFVDTKIERVEGAYIANISDLEITVRPHTLKNQNMANIKYVQQLKVVKDMTGVEGDVERNSILSKCVQEMNKMSQELLVDSIASITNHDDINLINDPANRKHIIEFLNNIPVTALSEISSVIERINKSRINKELSLTCRDEECGHYWTSEVDFNPINFFMGF